jgi:hypothetical protein
MLGTAVVERAKADAEREAQRIPRLLRMPADKNAEALVRQGTGASGAGRPEDPDIRAANDEP